MKNLAIKTLISFVIVAIIYAICFVYVDIPVAHWAHSLADTPTFHINEIISLAADSKFWDPLLGIALVTVFACEYKYGRKIWTRSLLYVILSIVLASVLGESLKFILGRYRPMMLSDEAKYGFEFFSVHWQAHSSPSGHTFRIFALMTALGYLFKPYRWLFITFAMMVGISRVILHAHYPSDVIFGAYLGALCAAWMHLLMFHHNKNH